jgi:hypothetical protein
MMDWNNTYAPGALQHAAARARLSALVQAVIENELDEQDRLLVRLHWYQGKRIEEIARLIGAERGFVYRRMDRIHKTIYDKLKYAVGFHFDDSFRHEADETLKTAGQSTFAIEALGGIGGRLAALRRQRQLDRNEIWRATGIPPARQQALEADGRRMMMTELSALTKLFGVGPNALLFGETEREWTQ